MARRFSNLAAALVLTAAGALAAAAADTVPVIVDNFVRAEAAATAKFLTACRSWRAGTTQCDSIVRARKSWTGAGNFPSHRFPASSA